MHVCTYAHMHMHVTPKNYMLRKLQMAATMKAAMFIMINMYGYVCAYVFTHAYMCACACICIQMWG